MADCPSCGDEVDKVRLAGNNTYYHVGEGSCGNPVDREWVGDNKDEFEVEIADDADDGGADSSDDGDDPEGGNPENEPQDGQRRQRGRPDRYSQRVQEKAQRVIDWVRGGPVGISPDSETADDFVQRLQKRPEVTDEGRTLQQWIESYFTQVPQPAMEDLFRDLEAIDQQYERQGEMFDTQMGGGQQPQQDSGGDSGIDEERLVRLMQASQQQGGGEPANKFTEARDEIVNEFGDAAADKVGNAGDRFEFWRNTLRDALADEIRNNPEFKQWLMKESLTNPLVGRILAALTDEDAPIDGEGLVEALSDPTGGGGGGGSDSGGGGAPMGGALGEMMGGGGGGGGPSGPDPDQRTQQARERAEARSDETEAPPPVTADGTDNAQSERETESEPTSEAGEPGTDTNPMTATPDDADDAGAEETETDNEEEVLDDFTEVA